tara:strand:+ start:544 stop:861 length:318 start_codon:yes stop_codon:yes gene_type:complete
LKKIFLFPKKLKILFIDPYSYNSFGIETLQTYIKSKWYHTETIFFKESKVNQLKKPTQIEKNILIGQIKKIDPKVICISIRSPMIELIKDTNSLIKDEMPNSFII